MNVTLVGYSSGGTLAAVCGLGRLTNFSEKANVRISHVVLVSGVYDMEFSGKTEFSDEVDNDSERISKSENQQAKSTDTPSPDSRGTVTMHSRFAAAFFRWIAGEPLGLNTLPPAARRAISPVQVARDRLDEINLALRQRIQSDQKSNWSLPPRWTLLNARNELFGLQPYQRLVFTDGAEELEMLLRKLGADRVDKGDCGATHWHLAGSVARAMGEQGWS